MGHPRAIFGGVLPSAPRPRAPREAPLPSWPSSLVLTPESWEGVQVAQAGVTHLTHWGSRSGLPPTDPAGDGTGNPTRGGAGHASEWRQEGSGYWWLSSRGPRSLARGRPSNLLARPEGQGHQAQASDSLLGPDPRPEHPSIAWACTPRRLSPCSTAPRSRQFPSGSCAVCLLGLPTPVITASWRSPRLQHPLEVSRSWAPPADGAGWALRGGRGDSDLSTSCRSRTKLSLQRCQGGVAVVSGDSGEGGQELLTPSWGL